MDAISDYVRVCETAVRAGGRVLLEKIGRVEVREKSPSDLVTEADLASQEVVRRTILTAFPDHSVIGEEDQPDGAGAEREVKPTEYRWFVDPLDGTTNYVHQVPHFCVSLALERSGELLVGTVYDPVAEECFSAAAGQGALLNGKPIRTSDVSGLSQTLAAVGLPAAVGPAANGLRSLEPLLRGRRSIRRVLELLDQELGRGSRRSLDPRSGWGGDRTRWGPVCAGKRAFPGCGQRPIARRTAGPGGRSRTGLAGTTRFA